MTDAQVTALGLPADPGELSVVDAATSAVRHGDHLDFVVNGRLLHIVDDATSDCGKSCAGGPGHGRSAAVVDHGLTVRPQGVAPAAGRFNSGGEFGDGIMPLAVSSGAGDGDATAGGALRQKAVADLVAVEHAGGDEASTHTRLKVLGICCQCR